MKHHKQNRETFKHHLNSVQTDATERQPSYTSIFRAIKRNNALTSLLLGFMLLALSPLFQSCQFDSDAENFVELQKPAEQIDIMINLYGLNPEEIIYVPLSSSFHYQIDADGRELLDIQFFLDGVKLTQYVSKESVYLENGAYDNLIHDLTVIVAFKTNTGSLAESLGLEAYLGAHEFKIKFLPEESQLNLRHTTDEDGYLVLEWDKPTGYEVSSYDVVERLSDGTGKTIKHIEDPNETSITIKDYVYGSKRYDLVAYIPNSREIFSGEDITIWSQTITDNDITLRRSSAKQVKVAWVNKNPYPARYVLEVEGNEPVFVEKGKSEAIVTVGNFPSRHLRFKLYVIPESADPKDYKTLVYNYNIAEFFISDNTMFNVSKAGVTHNNMILQLQNNTVNSYSLPDMLFVHSANHNLAIHSRALIRANNNGMIAINDVDYRIHIYSDYLLTEKINDIKLFHDDFQITDNGILMFTHDNGKQLRLYDINTGQQLYNKKWESERQFATVKIKANISADGKYVLVYCKDFTFESDEDLWIEIYETGDDYSLILTKKIDIEEIESVFFNPTNNNEIVIKNDNDEFSIMNLTTKEKKAFDGRLVYIDQFTGNLAYIENHHSKNPNIIILDKTYENKIFNMELSEPIWESVTPYIFNNLFVYNAMYINLSLLEEWKQ